MVHPDEDRVRLSARHAHRADARGALAILNVFTMQALVPLKKRLDRSGGDSDEEEDKDGIRLS